MLGLVVLGGEYDPPVRLAEWEAEAGLVVGADLGAGHALRLGLRPNLVVGDMDSLPEADLRQLAEAGAVVERHRSDKDETDAELAIRAALERGCDELVILCGLGGRLDHALANLFLLALPELEGRAILASGDTEVQLVTSEGVLRGRRGDLLTLLPFGSDALGVETEGLKYPLRGESLPLGYARGVSNVFTGVQAVVRLDQGRLLAVHIRGRADTVGGG